MAGRGGSGAASGRGPSQFSFYVSCDVNLQVRIKISELQGLLPAARTGLATLPPATGVWQGLPAGSPLELAASQAAAIAAAATATASGPAAAAARGAEPRPDGALGEGRMAPANSALYVSARITSCGDTLGLEAHSGYAQAYVYVPAVGDSGAHSSGAAAGQEHGSGAGGVGGAGGMQDSNAGLVLGPDAQGLGAPEGGGGGSSGSGPDSTAQWHEWLTFCVKVGGRGASCCTGDAGIRWACGVEPVPLVPWQWVVGNGYGYAVVLGVVVVLGVYRVLMG